MTILTPLFQFGLDFIEAFTDLGSADPKIIIARIIQALLGLLGIIALLMFLISGVLWMTSSGDEEKLGRARRTFVSAIIGLIIIFSANSIVQFIVNSLIETTQTTPDFFNRSQPF